MKCFMTGRECDYLAESTKGLFMLSPFGFPFDDLYKHALKPTLESLGHEINRADKTTLQLGYVMCQRICRQIQASKYIIADLSVPNANVYYELGLAYSLGKKIVIVQNNQTRHPFQKLFSDGTGGGSHVVGYTTLTDLKKVEPLKAALDNPILLNDAKRRPVFVESHQPILVNVENGMTPLAGLQEVSVQEAIAKDDSSSAWQVKTIRLTETDTSQKMVESIQDAKMCVIDITYYQDSKNMYVYFLLGLAHGFEKEVIPVINATLNKDVPFDIHGLWQIYFTRSEDLVDLLKDILPKARASIGTQERDYLYKQLWSPFMEARRTLHDEEKKSLHVMTCARNVYDKDRGDRTNLDKNDYTTVADLSFFIGETFEHAKVQIEPPTSKRTIADLTKEKRGKRGKPEIDPKAVNQLREDMYAQFTKLKGNWLIVGAPDSSDYSEVVLAHAHGIEPYGPEQDKSNLPFIFVKKRSDDNPLNASSFYESPSGEDEMIRWKPTKPPECTKPSEYQCKEWKAGEIRYGVTHGVITLLNRPRLGHEVPESKKFMILSGFTGIATYAMLEILTNVEYKEQYQELLNRYIKMQAQEKNVNILVSAEYCHEKAQVGGGNPGDTRKLTALKFVDIQEMCFQ